MRAVRTHLELPRPTDAASPPASLPAAPTLAVRRLPRATAGEYRALYAAVGRDYQWRDRDAWSDERLEAHLGDPAVSVWVATDGGDVAGYFELARRAAPDGATEVELVYFGLTAPFHGRGLGRALLERAIAEAWALGADRLVLNTCTLDHPAALPNYLARGFRVTREETYEVGAPPP